MKNTLKVAIVFLFLGFLVVRPTSSYAYWHDHGYVGVHIGVWGPGPYYGYGYGYPYYPYYADPYYSPSYAVVASSSYQPVVINGVTYYVNNGVYYIYTQYGYQAVATPAGAVSTVAIQAAPLSAGSATVVPAAVEADDVVTINIPNNKGSYTAVVIKKSGNGYVGPQGEFYAEFPRVSQLQVMYGK